MSFNFHWLFFDLVSHHNLWSPGWCWVRAICHSAKPPQRADQLTAFVSTSGSVLDESEHVYKLFLKCKKSQIVEINIKMMFLMSEGSKFRYVGVFFLDVSHPTSTKVNVASTASTSPHCRMWSFRSFDENLLSWKITVEKYHGKQQTQLSYHFTTKKEGILHW